MTENMYCEGGKLEIVLVGCDDAASADQVTTTKYVATFPTLQEKER
jgi:hypothetical protein